MKKVVLFAALFGAIGGGLWLGARHDAPSLAVSSGLSDSSAVVRGAAAFSGEDFGGLSMSALETHAVPWRLASAALVMDAVLQNPALPTDLSTLDRVLAGFGFLVDADVANAPDGLQLAKTAVPLGMTFGDLAPVAGLKLRVANLGCASCHAGVAYHADGTPDPQRAWLGMPNTSLNLEAYTLALFLTMTDAAARPEDWLDAVDMLYPDLDWCERATLRWMVLPMVRARLAEITGDRPMPFPNGVPGATNGVAALKFALSIPLKDGGSGETGFVSIPELGDRYMRKSLLADGAYAAPGLDPEVPTNSVADSVQHRASLAAITTFFTFPSMGVSPDHTITQTGTAEDIFAFLAETYAPQRFPGEIDTGLATRGAAIYAETCRTCHGTYDIAGAVPKLAAFPNWLGDVGTDPLRGEVFTDGLVDAVADTAYSATMNVRRTKAYIAPPLSGLWASAPYLHNGSVPTIAALLSPETRAEVFELGGHALDFQRMGLRLEGTRFPEGYAPFSTSVLYDTRKPGQGNAGHLFGSDLPPEDKRALIEFLKQL